MRCRLGWSVGWSVRGLEVGLEVGLKVREGRVRRWICPHSIREGGIK